MPDLLGLIAALKAGPKQEAKQATNFNWGENPMAKSRKFAPDPKDELAEGQYDMSGPNSLAGHNQGQYTKHVQPLKNRTRDPMPAYQALPEEAEHLAVVAKPDPLVLLQELLTNRGVTR